MKRAITKAEFKDNNHALIISASVVFLCSIFASSLMAADLHQAEPGEIVILREVTPQPHNRINQQGPILNKVDLRPDPTATEHLIIPINKSIEVINLTDEQAAGVRGSAPAGNMVREALSSDESPIGGHGSHSLANGHMLNRTSDTSGRLYQVLSGSGGAQGGGATNNAMKGFSDALGQALGGMHRQ